MSELKKSTQYDLPVNWDKREMFSFNELSSAIEQIHIESQCSALKSINRFTTIRNYLIGFYIVEYEQAGSDRAEYGTQLLKNLEKEISQKIGFLFIKCFVYNKNDMAFYTEFSPC